MTQTATDANRAVLRHAREITGRPRVLVFDHCYHGTLDETLVVAGPDGATLPRPGQIGRIVDPAVTTAVVEFNDLPALERRLARGDIACVLTEPALTNAGLVLPEPGFLEGVARLAREHGALLALDETHTLSAGRGGYARRAGLAADFVVCGKAIAGGLPCAVFGFTAAVDAAMRAAESRRAPGHSGVGTTLAANPLAFAALQACLTEVMTARELRAHGSPRGAARRPPAGRVLGARARVCTCRASVRAWSSVADRRRATGARVSPRHAPALESAMHLFLLNRGFLLTPFHNMMLISPVTTLAQLERFVAAFHDCLDAFAAHLKPDA